MEPDETAFSSDLEPHAVAFLPDEDFSYLVQSCCPNCQDTVFGSPTSSNSVSSSSTCGSSISISSATDSCTPVSTPSSGCSRSFSSDEMIQQIVDQPSQAEPHRGDFIHTAVANGGFPIRVTKIPSRPKQIFRCGPCEKYFANKYSLARHQDRYNCGPGTGKFILCEKCEEIFKRTDKYNDHLAKHSQDASPAQRDTGSV